MGIKIKASVFQMVALVLLLGVASPINADVGVILALNETIDNLTKGMVVDGRREIAKRHFISGTIDKKPVVFVRSPMGKVNNAMTTQLLISKYSVDTIISISPAGAIDTNLKVGDVVIANSLFHHDFGTIKPYGLIKGKEPNTLNWRQGDFKEKNKFLLGRAIAYKSKGKSSIHYGPVVSGDQFISSESKREWIYKNYNALAVDMGAAAIGQVCKSNQVEFLAIRILTDKAGVNAGVPFGSWMNPYKTDVDLRELMTHLLLKRKTK